METLPLLHFNLVMNLWLLFVVSVKCFSSYCEACKSLSCGGGCEFGYPFVWNDSGCGDPALQLRCDNHNFHDSNMPMLDIKGNQYYILNFTSLSSTLEDIVMIIIDRHRHCDLPSTNCTPQFWPSDQFQIVDEHTNITVLELGECQHDTHQRQDKHSKSRCNRKLYYNSSSDRSWTGKCKPSFLNDHPPGSNGKATGSNWKQTIREGAKIRWKPSSSCKKCMSEKGTCAYSVNITSNPFVCKGRVKSISSALLGCSIGGAVVVAVCVFVFLICYVRRRKAQLIQGICSINNYHKRTDMEAAVGNLPMFTFKQLRQATNCFHENNELGDGGFGKVYLGNLKDGRTVAIKRLYQQNSRRMEQFINEVIILSSLHHPNLVQLYGCTRPESPELLLVYEFVPNGTLADHLHGSRRTPKGLPWIIRLNIAIETAQALSFLHSVNPPIFHRDVKSTNILLHENYTTKVADFGLSRLVPVDVSHVTTAPQGTPGYLDPEYHQCFQLTEKSDVYSFGVVLVELISAKLAVDITRNRNQISLAGMAIEKIRTGALHELVDLDLETETNHEVKAMVSAVAVLAFGCLAGDRDFRPDMKEVAERLEKIRLLYETTYSEQQSSMSKEYSTKMSVSPTSVHEEWPSTASNNSV